MICKDCIYALETVRGGYSCSLAAEEMDLCIYIINGGMPDKCPKSKWENADNAES